MAAAYQIVVDDDDYDGDNVNYSDFALWDEEKKKKQMPKNQKKQISGNNAFFALEEEMVMLIYFFVRNNIFGDEFKLCLRR